MKNNSELKYTSQILVPLMKQKKWFVPLGIKASTASMWKKRLEDDELSEDKISEIMNMIGYVRKRKREESMWEKMEKVPYLVFSDTKDYGTIEAYSPEQAIDQIAQSVMGTTEKIINIEGSEQFKWKSLACLLYAKEVI